MRNECLERTLIGLVHENSAIETFLTLALLHEEMVLCTTVVRELAASRSVDTLLRATV